MAEWRRRAGPLRLFDWIAKLKQGREIIRYAPERLPKFCEEDFITPRLVWSRLGDHINRSKCVRRQIQSLKLAGQAQSALGDGHGSMPKKRKPFSRLSRC